MCIVKNYSRHTLSHRLQSRLLNKIPRGLVILPLVFILLLSLSYVVFSSARSIIEFSQLDRGAQRALVSSLSARQATRHLAKRAALTPLDELRSHQHVYRFNITQLDFKGANGLSVMQFSIVTSTPDGSPIYKESFIKYPSILALPHNTSSFDVDNALTEVMFNRALKNLSHHYFPAPLYSRGCEDLQKKVVIWVEGNCLLTAKHVEHTNTKSPILLVVENGDITFQKEAHFYGLLIMLSRTSTINKVTMHPRSTLTGLALATDAITTHIDGMVLYSFEVLQHLQNHPALFKVMPIPGTAYEY